MVDFQDNKNSLKMAHFNANIQVGKKVVTRKGTDRSGIITHTGGLNVGVYVTCRMDPKTRKDVCTIWKTGGSNDYSKQKKIGVVKS